MNQSALTARSIEFDLERYIETKSLSVRVAGE